MGAVLSTTWKATLSASPVDVLRREHDLTRRMLAVLERIAAGVELGLGFPAADTARVLGYLRDFVEQVHHAKEVRHCYPLATMLGDDEVAETVGELVADHDESKVLLHSLTVSSEPDDLLDVERKVFAELARTYVHRLRRHMDLEERVLFPTLDAAPATERDALLESFGRTAPERGELRAWTREALRLERVHPS